MEVFQSALNCNVNELSRIMSICFNEPIEVTDFFFKEKFNLADCYVCLKNNKPVSLLHALPSQINFAGEVFGAVYIFGVCTLSDHRNKGYMKKLLNYAEKKSLERGYKCSFLVPAGDDLTHFYEKLGYKNYFYRKQVFLDNEDITKISEKACEEPQNFPSKEDLYVFMEKLRSQMYNKENAVVYNSQDIKFADLLYKRSGGGMVCTPHGYALCAQENHMSLRLRDFICKHSQTPNLFKKIRSAFPNVVSWIIETSCGNEFFKNMGEIKCYGMAKFLSADCEKASRMSIYPYLGISLE